MPFVCIMCCITAPVIWASRVSVWKNGSTFLCILSLNQAGIWGTLTKFCFNSLKRNTSMLTWNWIQDTGGHSGWRFKALADNSETWLVHYVGCLHSQMVHRQGPFGHTHFILRFTICSGGSVIEFCHSVWI